MKKIYAFSGLGADSRAFAKLDLSGFEVIHIEWLQPNANETLATYVRRLAEHYNIPVKGAHLIGLSFGGICVTELSKCYDIEKAVLISTAKTKYELPRLYRMSRFFNIYKLFPNKKIVKLHSLFNWLFGVKDEESKRIFLDILESTDPIFLNWAVKSVVTWRNEDLPKEFFHIHGDKDKILPFHNINYVMRIRSGGHLLILDRADEISVHMRKYLA